MPGLGFLTGALGFLKSLPWQVYAAIAAAAALAFGVHEHKKAVKAAYSAAYAQGSKDTADAFQRAQAKADALALKQKQDMEARYAALATQKDQEYQTGLQGARDATARYIATHSVRPASNQDRSGTTVAAADDHGSGVPEKLSAQAVMVSPDDVQACSAAVSYGIAAHDWAVSLPKK